MTTNDPSTNGNKPNDATSLALVQARLELAKIPKSKEMEGWELLNRQATAFANSSLVPKEYQGNVPNCIIAVQMALRIGADPFMVMQNLDIIHGRPGWRSQFLIATVNASGRFTPLRYRFEGTPGKDDWGCRAVAKDRSDGEELVGTLIDIAMAKREGWYQKAGSKWQTMPEQMLRYRAAGFWTRAYCPELSMGIHTVEEVIDTVGVPVPDSLTTSPNDAKDLQAALADTPAALPAATIDAGDGEKADAATGEIVEAPKAKRRAAPVEREPGSDDVG